MKTEQRRSPRHADFLPITVSVGGKGDGDALLAGPFSARLVDISNHGACLLLTEVLLHTFHIFHSTREDEHAALHLQIKLPHQPDSVLILARPVWLHGEETGERKIFRMGVDFLAAINNDLLVKINRTRNKQ